MQDYTRLDSYRYERKFVSDRVTRPVAETIIKQNGAFFTMTYPPRQVNNIYFDTPGMDCYFGNLFGIGNRWKVRIRWYGDLLDKIRSPILEFKIKKGHTGSKRSFGLPFFETDPDHFDSIIWKSYFQSANLPPEVIERITGLQPVLLNAYYRSYFESINKKFRVTLDDQMQYYNLRPTWNNFLQRYNEGRKSVIELKYDPVWEEETGMITNQFPFRVDKNSKYISGVSYFRNEIPL